MNTPSLSRRRFLRHAGIGTLALAGGFRERPVVGADDDVPAPSAVTSDPPGLSRLTEHLAVYHGPINVGIVHQGARALLFDCGDGSVAAALAELDGASIDRILFTHHHRDQACGAFALAAGGARIVVPADEREHFDNVAAYWANPKSRWHIYSQHPHHLMLAEPVRVDAAMADGDQLAWGPAKIRAMATPGHTDGSLSYLVEIDGKRIVFCGDAIYDQQGRVWEIHSLQKGTQTTDYHGFLGARPELVESLRRIEETRPDLLIPSHGTIIADPSQAVERLVARLDRCYDRYVAISALRHYFPKLFTQYAGRKDHMPIRPGKPAPDCLRHIGTSWILVSKDKAAFVMDCGNRRVIEGIEQFIEQDEVRRVEGLWVTHYHDDHVDAIPDFQKAFDCPCITDRSVAEVIGDPLAWRLPCISPSRARVDRATRDGESWTWHEFRLTAYHFPGQTLYHSGLFVEGEGLRMLFVGDSFTMAGIDDYCAPNRNWLGAGVGFDRCIALIEKLRPTHVFNCHVAEAFDFTAEQCRQMRANLAEREGLFGQLVPWPHANFGMDEPWVRCHPYEQRAEPGAKAAFRVVATNHAETTARLACRAVLPRTFGGATAARNRATRWSSVPIPSKTDGEVPLSFSIPSDTPPGRYVVAVDVRLDDRSLPQFTEAVVVV